MIDASHFCLKYTACLDFSSAVRSTSRATVSANLAWRDSRWQSMLAVKTTCPEEGDLTEKERSTRGRNSVGLLHQGRKEGRKEG